MPDKPSHLSNDYLISSSSLVQSLATFLSSLCHFLLIHAPPSFRLSPYWNVMTAVMSVPSSFTQAVNTASSCKGMLQSSNTVVIYCTVRIAGFEVITVALLIIQGEWFLDVSKESSVAIKCASVKGNLEGDGITTLQTSGSANTVTRLHMLRAAQGPLRFLTLTSCARNVATAYTGLLLRAFICAVPIDVSALPDVSK